MSARQHISRVSLEERSFKILHCNHHDCGGIVHSLSIELTLLRLLGCLIISNHHSCAVPLPITSSIGEKRHKGGEIKEKLMVFNLCRRLNSTSPNNQIKTFKLWEIVRGTCWFIPISDYPAFPPFFQCFPQQINRERQTGKFWGQMTARGKVGALQKTEKGVRQSQSHIISKAIFRR